MATYPLKPANTWKSPASPPNCLLTHLYLINLAFPVPWLLPMLALFWILQKPSKHVTNSKLYIVVVVLSQPHRVIFLKFKLNHLHHSCPQNKILCMTPTVLLHIFSRDSGCSQSDRGSGVLFLSPNLASPTRTNINRGV